MLRKKLKKDWLRLQFGKRSIRLENESPHNLSSGIYLCEHGARVTEAPATVRKFIIRILVRGIPEVAYEISVWKMND